MKPRRTKEEVRLITTYGRCLVCAEPRYPEHRHLQTAEGTMNTTVLTCRNGHDVQ